MARRVLVAVIALAVAGTAILARWETPAAPPAAAALTVTELLGGIPAEGFARADRPRPFVFPLDHGPHPEYRNEWWYYTGNLIASDGRRFGYQLTFFRTALAPEVAPRSSAWAARQAWMAHFAVTDVGGRRFHTRSRLARGALELAGATAEPFRVWLEDWSAGAAGTGAPTPVTRLRAAEDGLEIDLTLVPRKPPVLNGDRGLSVKGDVPGQASYYYSVTRLDTRGRLVVDGAGVEVHGTSWLDREWSTSALADDQVGWDWFAIQLDDGRDLMVYRLRRADGSADPRSAGTLITAEGGGRTLEAADVRLDVLDWWSSPRGGHRYPVRWRITVPAVELVLDVRPRLADQEWSEPVRYWEGAVEVTGRAGTTEVRGEGYAELVGYADAPGGAGGR